VLAVYLRSQTDWVGINVANAVQGSSHAVKYGANSSIEMNPVCPRRPPADLMANLVGGAETRRGGLRDVRHRPVEEHMSLKFGDSVIGNIQNLAVVSSGRCDNVNNLFRTASKSIDESTGNEIAHSVSGHFNS
jgi:hypothetical protein